MTRLSSRAMPFLKWVMPANWQLIVGGVGVRVPLADMVSVSVPNYSRSRRISLRLRRPGQLGDEIAFLPSTRLHWNPFARDPLVEDLIRRVDAARTGAAQ